MIPLRDYNPTRRVPWMTVAIILANAAVFAVELSVPRDALPAFMVSNAFVPAHFLASPFSPSQWLTVFAAMFMHAGWLHIGGNMLYLWIFGNNIEDRLGPLPFLGFYLTAGIAATAAQTLASSTSAMPILGASGAIAGVLGAYLVLFPGAVVLTLVPVIFFLEIARLPAFVVIGFWFVLQLANGALSLDPGVSASGGVAWFAHIGGFVAGLVLVAPLVIADPARRNR